MVDAKASAPTNRVLTSVPVRWAFVWRPTVANASTKTSALCATDTDPVRMFVPTLTALTAAVATAC